MRDPNLVRIVPAILDYRHSSLLQLVSRNVVAESTQAKINTIFYYIHLITTGGESENITIKI